MNNMPATSNIQMNTLIRAVDIKAKQKSDLLERMGNLLTKYKNHKVAFKEETFTLFDMADFIHTEITDQKDNDLFFLLVAKFKVAVNGKFGRSAEAEVDPRKQFDVTELDSVFMELCEKNQKEIQVVTGFLEE